MSEFSTLQIERYFVGFRFGNLQVYPIPSGMSSIKICVRLWWTRETEIFELLLIISE